MRIDFLKSVIVVTLVLVVLLAYPFIAWAGPEVRAAMLAAAAIALMNAVAGLAMIEYGIDKSNSTFMISVLGGMGIRIGIILLVLTILLLNGFHQMALVLFLMAFYLIYLATELYYVVRFIGRRGKFTQRNIERRQRQRTRRDAYYFQSVRN